LSLVDQGQRLIKTVLGTIKLFLQGTSFVLQLAPDNSEIDESPFPSSLVLRALFGAWVKRVKAARELATD
jgi:hypothetical protein